MATDLFSFGTLMDAELLQLVCGSDISAIVKEPALVADHAALWVQDDHYPVLVPRVGARTEGLILRNLMPEALARIVFFEGGEFTVQRIEVINASGVLERIPFFADNDHAGISDVVWRLEDWQETTKPDTMPRVERYMQCYGKMGVDEADAYW